MPNPDPQDSPTTVLVVDDEEGIRQALDRFLTRLGYKVLQAASGAEALDRQAADQPQAMLSDIRMPNMSGVELVPKALALDSDGKPVAVQNSDEAFSLLLLDLVPDEVARIATTLARPFPAGLMTGAGMLVANPAFADAALQPEFDKTHYHGTVVWSWQQALVRAGIERQLARRDLPRAVLALLERTRAQLRSATGTTQGLRGSELWSWSWSRGRYSAAPFGQLPGDETESNAAQLWSTVHLAAPGR